MNDIDKRTKHMRRRILASVCAVAIALLQCAVIVTIGTEDAYAAGSVDITVNYSDGKSATETGHSISSSDKIECNYTVDVDGEQQEKTLILKGAYVSSIISGISDPKEVSVGGKTLKNGYGDWILVNEASGDIPDGMSADDFRNRAAKAYTSLDDIRDIKDQTASTKVAVKKNTEAVKITINGMPAKLKVNQPYQLSADVQVDEFYKNNTDAEPKELTWKSSKSNVIEVNYSGLITVKSEGNATITAEQYGGKGSVDGKGESDKKNIKDAIVTGVKDKTYTGKDQVQSGYKVTLGGKLKEGTDYTVSYKNNKNVGTATMVITGKGKYTGTKNVNFKIKKQTTSKAKYKPATGSYRTYATRHTLSGGATTSTGTTVPNVTYAPDRTITVKEVFLGQQIQDEPAEEPTPADMMDAASDDMMDDANDDWAEDESVDLDFGPMAGSAAVATAACGAGVVGRIRRFKVDTAAKAVSQITNSKGK